MKYRKKPVIIEAVQWTGDFDKLKEHSWIREAIEKVFIRSYYASINDPPRALLIDTLEGEMTAKLGDFIILGVKGEIYPCREDIFKMTYESAEGKEGEAAILKAVHQMGVPSLEPDTFEAFEHILNVLAKTRHIEVEFEGLNQPDKTTHVDLPECWEQLSIFVGAIKR